VSIQRVQFRRLIAPGGQMIIEVVAICGKGWFGKIQATVVVG